MKLPERFPPDDPGEGLNRAIFLRRAAQQYLYPVGIGTFRDGLRSVDFGKQRTSENRTLPKPSRPTRRGVEMHVVLNGSRYSCGPVAFH